MREQDQTFDLCGPVTRRICEEALGQEAGDVKSDVVYGAVNSEGTGGHQLVVTVHVEERHLGGRMRSSACLKEPDCSSVLKFPSPNQTL